MRFLAAFVALAGVGIIGYVALHWRETEIGYAILAVACGLAAVGIACSILYD